jgi:hypothetical protein
MACHLAGEVVLMEISQKTVEAKVSSAIDKLMANDRLLLQYDANERSISHKLAEYLQLEFTDWNVDCEYNRKGHDPKRLNLKVDQVFTDNTQAKTVYPENMQRNLNCFGGVVFSQRVLLALVDKGVSREEAYAIVQSCAHTAWNQPDGNFEALIRQDERVQQHLDEAAIDNCFDPQQHLKHLDVIYQRLNI